MDKILLKTLQLEMINFLSLIITDIMKILFVAQFVLPKSVRTYALTGNYGLSK